jgi:pyruvate/2-oxoglutarate dehydrogenase complex dihydrolipoamide acyltransferase (E2) component
MLSTPKRFPAVVFAAALLVLAAPAGTYMAAAQSAQSTPAAQAPTPTPTSPNVVAASPEAIKLLKLMDVDNDGRISHAEFMAFMEAEFKRLDLDKDGYLNLKELEKSQLAVAHHGGTHR